MSKMTNTVQSKLDNESEAAYRRGKTTWMGGTSAEGMHRSGRHRDVYAIGRKVVSTPNVDTTLRFLAGNFPFSAAAKV